MRTRDKRQPRQVDHHSRFGVGRMRRRKGSPMALFWNGPPRRAALSSNRQRCFSIIRPHNEPQRGNLCSLTRIPDSFWGYRQYIALSENAGKVGDRASLEPRQRLPCLNLCHQNERYIFFSQTSYDMPRPRMLPGPLHRSPIVSN
jgi:hypothetical protein